MRFVTVRDLRSESARIWRSLSKDKELVITSNGKPIAILTATDEGSVEESLAAIRRARAEAAVAALRESSAQQGTRRLSAKAINAEIAAARRERKR